MTGFSEGWRDGERRVGLYHGEPAGWRFVCGVTADLVRRVYEHRVGEVVGFTRKYGVKRLVYFERFEDIAEAIAREKVIKHWDRAQKVRVIMEGNFGWDDLYEGIL